MTSKTPPFFILTGAPGSGKTTLLEALAADFATVPEFARRVLAQQRLSVGLAPSVQVSASFVQAMLAMAVADYRNASGLTIFDRGLPDLLAYCVHYNLPDTEIRQAIAAHPYRPCVLHLLPWEDIYETDADRRLNFPGAAAFGRLIQQAYLDSGYRLIEVPKGCVTERADFVRAYITR